MTATTFQAYVHAEDGVRKDFGLFATSAAAKLAGQLWFAKNNKLGTGWVERAGTAQNRYVVGPDKLDTLRGVLATLGFMHDGPHNMERT